MSVRRHLGVYLGYLGVAVALTWPALVRLGDSIPGEKFMVTWYIWTWLVDHPFSTWLSPVFDTFNFPDGGSVTIVGLPQFLVAWALVPLFGEATALNLSLVLHLALGGYAGWRLSRAVWGELPEAAHLVAGLGWGFSNYAVAAFSNGQSENIGLAYLAFAAEAAWSVSRGGGARAILALVGWVAVCFVSTPYFVMAGLLLVAIPALRHLRSRDTWIAAAGVLAVCAFFFLHFQRTLPGVEGRLFCPHELAADPEPGTTVDLARESPGGVLRRPDLFTQTLVVDPVWAFVPHRTWGTKAHELPANWLGWTLPALALLGWWGVSGRRWWLLAPLPAAVLGLGLSAQVNGWVLTWEAAPLRLPLWWLRELPGLGAVFGTINAPHRLIVAVHLPLSLLAARGVSRLGRGAWAVPVLVLAEALLVSPSRPPQPLFDVPAVEAYAALAAERDGLALVDTPPVGFSSGPPLRPPVTFTRRLMGAAWQHDHPLPYAPCAPSLLNDRLESTAFARIVGEVLRGRSDGSGLRAAAAELRTQGYGWYVVHTGTGLVDPQADARILAAARAQLREVHAGGDGSVLFGL